MAIPFKVIGSLKGNLSPNKSAHTRRLKAQQYLEYLEERGVDRATITRRMNKLWQE
jgi:hypothetical protein